MVAGAAAIGGTAVFTLDLDYTNAGGLPAGGSLVVEDLEYSNSYVTITGFRGGEEVDVDWTVSFLEIAGLNAPFPTWDPATNTLSGVGEGGPDYVNLVFLVSDVQLDSVRFDACGAGGDFMGFNTAAQTIDLRRIPEPATLSLLGMAIAMGAAPARKRRTRPVPHP